MRERERERERREVREESSEPLPRRKQNRITGRFSQWETRRCSFARHREHRALECVGWIGHVRTSGAPFRRFCQSFWNRLATRSLRSLFVLVILSIPDDLPFSFHRRNSTIDPTLFLVFFVSPRRPTAGYRRIALKDTPLHNLVHVRGSLL